MQLKCNIIKISALISCFSRLHKPKTTKTTAWHFFLTIALKMLDLKETRGRREPDRFPAESKSIYFCRQPKIKSQQGGSSKHYQLTLLIEG